MNDNEALGIFPDMPNAEYHAHPAIGSSGLKLLSRSPSHYWAAYLDPNREPRKQTDAMKLGTLTHTALLEPGVFDTLFTIMPEGLDRRTKEGKDIWAAIIATGKEPVSESMFKSTEGMVLSAQRHPVMRTLFERCNAVTEQSIFWRDPETGLLCKIRPDIMVEPCDLFPNGLIADMKTTEDASPAEFARSAWNWDMHLQAALYPEGFMQTFGTDEPPAFLWLAQEKTAPFANRFYACGADLSEHGMREVRRLLRIAAECQRTNTWPGYPTAVETLVLPAFAQSVINGSEAA